MKGAYSLYCRKVGMRMSFLLAVALVALVTPQPVRSQSLDDLVHRAVRPLPEELRAEATVFRYDPDTGERVVLRHGTNHVECSPEDDDDFTRCYPRSSSAWRDLRARLTAEGLEGDAVRGALDDAVEEGTVQPPAFGSLSYRLSEDAGRIKFLWMISVPGATSAELAMPTGSQRDEALEGRGTPWMMNEGTAGAHLMIPINGTVFSNSGELPRRLDASVFSDPVAQATLPLPEDLRVGATVSTRDPTTGERRVLRQGTNSIECRPRNPETGYTRCYHESVWVGRDLSARLQAEGRSEEEITAALEEARASGALSPTAFASLAYRLYDEDDRVRLLWMVRVPNATAAELGMPTGSQRDNALAGRGTPWMMNEGTPGAHLMIPISGTALSNRE